MNTKKIIRSCQEKITFETRQLAQEMVVKLYHQKGYKLKPYHCSNCLNWHLTKQDPRKSLMITFRKVEEELRCLKK